MPEHPKSSFTFISRRAPYGNDNSQICLDLVLATSVYDQVVNYLFVEDGVYQLLSSQQANAIGSKNLLAALGALELYGVETVYVDRKSLEDRKLSTDDLAIVVDVVDDAQITKLIREADMVFNL